MKLLLIEDNPADARLIQELLKQANGGSIEFAGVATLQEGLQNVRQAPLDVVLLDLGLPDSQGLETLGRMHAAAGDVPIVVLTGRNDLEFASAAVRAGAQDYLVKGRFDGELLVRTIRYAIERKHAQQKIRHLAAIVDSCSDAVISKSLDGVVLSWNGGAERMYGYPAPEMIGQPVLRLLPPEQANELSALLARVKRGERIERYETVRQAKDGRLLEVLLSVSPVLDDTGEVVAASTIAADITERKRAEDALAASHAELQRFHQLAINRELRIIELKQRVNQLSGELNRVPPFQLGFVPPGARQKPGRAEGGSAARSTHSAVKAAVYET